MTSMSLSFYNLILGLWVGGITIVSLIVTPSIFKTFSREKAGEVVGAIFPGYFLFNFLITLFALIFFIILFGRNEESTTVSKIILIGSVCISALHKFKLHPTIKRIKEEIKAIELNKTSVAKSDLKKKFGKMHFASFALNMILLCFGVALIFLAPTS